MILIGKSVRSSDTIQSRILNRQDAKSTITLYKLGNPAGRGATWNPELSRRRRVCQIARLTSILRGQRL